jgi:hypothetical protein
MRQGNWFCGIAILTLAAALASGQYAPFAIVPISPPAGSLGVQYPEQVLSTTGGYNTSNVPAWSISAGQLPAGLTFAAGVGDYAYDAIISGTPTATGLFSFTVQAVQTDANFGPPLTATLPLTIFIAGSQLAITTPSLPSGQAGVAYTQAWTMGTF